MRRKECKFRCSCQKGGKEAEGDSWGIGKSTPRESTLENVGTGVNEGGEWETEGSGRNSAATAAK